MKYAENEIRDACREMAGISPADGEELITILRKGHGHDFADTDTVTVKELRDACKDFLAAGDVPLLLRRISERREPEYKSGKVYRTADGTYLRYSGERWFRFGNPQPFISLPQSFLPLEEMP